MMSYFTYFILTFHKITTISSMTFFLANRSIFQLFLTFPPLTPYSSMQKQPFITAHFRSSLHILTSLHVKTCPAAVAVLGFCVWGANGGGYICLGANGD